MPPRSSSRLGGEREQDEVGVGGERHPLVGELEAADERMVEAFQSGVVGADVVACPADAEVFALRRQFADQVRQLLVVRVAAGFCAKDSDEASALSSQSM